MRDFVCILERYRVKQQQLKNLVFVESVQPLGQEPLLQSDAVAGMGVFFCSVLCHDAVLLRHFLE